MAIIAAAGIKIGSRAADNREPVPGWGQPGLDRVHTTTRNVMPFRSIHLFLGLCLVLLAACGKDPASDLARLRHDAEAFAEAGQFKAAIENYKALLRRVPDDAAVRYALGRAYLHSRQHEAALKEFRRAEQNGMRGTELATAAVEAQLALGRYKEALETIEAARREAPGSRQFYVAEARARLGLREADAARSALEEAQKHQPDSPEILRSLAELALSQNDRDSAIAQLDAALAAAPKDTKALALRAQLHAQQGEYAEAEGLWSRIAAVDPDDPVAAVGLVEARLMQNKLAEAQALLPTIKAQLSERNPQYQFVRGLLAAQAGDDKTAIEALQQVLKQLPDHLQSKSVLGDLYLRAGKDQQAYEMLAAVNRRMPNSSPVAMRLAMLMLKRGDGANARKVLAANEDDPTIGADHLAMLSYAAFSDGDSEAGESWLARAAEQDGDSPIVQRMQGLLALVHGKMPPGTAGAEIPEDHSLALMSAYAALRDKDTTRAREVADALLARAPGEAAVSHLDGLVLLAAGDAAAAEKRFSAALAQSVDFVPSLLSLAELAARRGDAKAAGEYLQRILATYPGHLQAQLAMAQLAALRGDSAATEKWLVQAVEAHPKAARPSLLLARQLIAQGRPDEALRRLDAVQKLAPHDAGIARVRARAELDAGNPAEAVRIFERLLKEAPDDRDRRREYAVALGQAGQVADARTRLQALLKDDATEAPTLRALAQLETRADQPSAALAAAERLVAARPEDPSSQMFRGDLLLAQGRARDAAAAYAEAIRHGGGSPAVVRQAEAWVNAGAPGEANAGLEAWLATHPDDVAARGKLAEMALLGDEPQRAIDLYRSLIEDAPNDVQALNNLAYLLAESDDKEALGYAEKAFELMPGNAAVADTLGWLLVQQGTARRGVQVLEKATKLDPEQSTIRYHYAHALAAAGDEREARKVLTELLAANVAFPAQNDAKALLRRLERGGDLLR